MRQFVKIIVGIRKLSIFLLITQRNRNVYCYWVETAVTLTVLEKKNVEEELRMMTKIGDGVGMQKN